jgi:predicted Zn-ribbon and HTH transcriptional regulator
VSILGRYEERNVSDKEPASGTHNTSREDRPITKDQICKVVNELENLTSNQKQKLSAILLKYQGSLTKKPSKCKSFEYTFQVEGKLPKSTYSCPIPFALRLTVSEEIRQLMKDGILEESHSAYLNPLTVVQREGKSPRICVDARKINQITIPDRAKVELMQELLQRFHGTKYITTFDLSSAFLQVPLDEVSRKYTAFEFRSKVYQYG